MTRKGKNIYLQFKTPNTARKPYACGCTFTLDGMVNALSKSNKVAEALKNLTSETDFWNWYDKEIKEESQLVDDQRTFIQAIIEVKRDFWSRPSRTKRKRDKTNPSDQSSWYDTYGRFYKHLPEYKTFNLKDIQAVINKWDKGTKTYKGVVSAMKKLAELSRRKDIHEELSTLDVTQVKYKEMQNATLKDFLEWRDIAGCLTHLSETIFSKSILYQVRIIN